MEALSGSSLVTFYFKLGHNLSLKFVSPTLFSSSIIQICSDLLSHHFLTLDAENYGDLNVKTPPFPEFLLFQRKSYRLYNVKVERNFNFHLV